MENGILLLEYGRKRVLNINGEKYRIRHWEENKTHYAECKDLDLKEKGDSLNKVLNNLERQICDCYFKKTKR